MNRTQPRTERLRNQPATNDKYAPDPTHPCDRNIPDVYDGWTISELLREYCDLNLLGPVQDSFEEDADFEDRMRDELRILRHLATTATPRSKPPTNVREQTEATTPDSFRPNQRKLKLEFLRAAEQFIEGCRDLGRYQFGRWAR